MLYLLYRKSPLVALGTTADDIAILITHNNQIEASLRLQKSLLSPTEVLKKENQSWGQNHVTFITRKETCLPVTLGILQVEDAKYLGLRL